jgi:NAD(P)-dependent dehydrogenase (short-subunit alcohol dehydrogenase family)
MAHGASESMLCLPDPMRTPTNEGLGDMANQIAGIGAADGRWEPEELAAAIDFLASDDASFVHCVMIPVDGGRVAT